MNSICNQEFFIYVPTKNDVETLTHLLFKGQGESTHAKDKYNSKCINNMWVRIPLAGQVVVYARLLDKEVALK
jgi:hypothetical protein